MGCECTSAFVGKGKVRHLSLLERNPQAQHAFANLVTAEQLNDEMLNTAEAFICSMYCAKKNQSSLNNLRYQIIERAFGPKPNANNPLKKLRGIGGRSILPYRNELIPHAKRVAFVAKMWANAHNQFANQKPQSPEDGWELISDLYEIMVFSGPLVPDDMVSDSEEESVLDDDSETEYVDDTLQSDSSSEDESAED